MNRSKSKSPNLPESSNMEPESSFKKIDDNSKQSKAIDAAMFGNLSQLKEYIEKGLDITEPDKYGRSILAYPCLQGQYDVAEYLLEEKGLDPNVTDPKGRTTLHWIAQSSSPDVNIFKLLYNHGTDLNLQDEDGNTPLLLAVQHTSTENFIRTLLQYGAKKNIRNYDTGRNADKTSKKGKGVVRVALQHGGPVWAQKVEQLVKTTRKLSSVVNAEDPTFRKKTGGRDATGNKEEAILSHSSEATDDFNQMIHESSNKETGQVMLKEDGDQDACFDDCRGFFACFR